jgi:hypothetical protein
VKRFGKTSIPVSAEYELADIRVERFRLVRTRPPLVFLQGAAVHIGWQNAAASLPELIFRAVDAALTDSELSIHEIDSVVLSAHDIVDGRSLSSMVTAPAAGAYLKDEIRLAEDGLAAMSLASARIEAGESRFSIVAAWGRASEGDYVHTSHFAFDPFLEQPFGLDEFSLSAMRLSEWIREHGEEHEAHQQAISARAERARRNCRSVLVGVRPPVDYPLESGDAPRFADIVVVTVLGGRPRAVHIAGIGHSADFANLGERRLSDMRAVRESVSRACQVAQSDVRQLDVLQLAGPTLPDEALALESIGVAAPGEAFAAYAAMGQVNPSGGSESGWCFPTNGLLNVVEAYYQLTQQAGAGQVAGSPRRALATGVSPLGGQVAHAAVLAAE